VTRPVEERSAAALVHGTWLVAPPAGEPRAAVVGFHGYGETAADHLEALSRLPGAEAWLLVAVQSLHPFYRRDGSVVWSWMTRHDRERAIVDNTRYALTVLDAVAGDFPGVAALAFAGFSQGVAMAWRAAAAAAAAGRPVRALVGLAGDVPPDVAAGDLAGFPPVLLGRGATDSWYTDAKLDADMAALAARGVAAEALVFAGGHEWTPEFLGRAGAFLAAHLA
jgi:predicted esterase